MMKLRTTKYILKLVCVAPGSVFQDAFGRNWWFPFLQPGLGCPGGLCGCGPTRSMPTGIWAGFPCSHHCWLVRFSAGVGGTVFLARFAWNVLSRDGKQDFCLSGSGVQPTQKHWSSLLHTRRLCGWSCCTESQSLRVILDLGEWSFALPLLVCSLMARSWQRALLMCSDFSWDNRLCFLVAQSPENKHLAWK